MLASVSRQGANPTVRSAASAAEVLAAAKLGDASRLESAKRAWYTNGDDIAAFLSGASPNWPPAEMRDMLSDGLARQFPGKF